MDIRLTEEQMANVLARINAIADAGRPIYRGVEVAQETGSEAAVAYAAGRWEGFIDGLRAVFTDQLVTEIVEMIESGSKVEGVIQ